MAEKKRTVFDIVGDFDALNEVLAETGGDLTDPEVEQIYEQFLAEIKSDFANKADGYARVLADIQGKIDAQKAEVDRLNALIKSNKGKADRLRWLLQTAMIATGYRKVETNLHVFTIAKNGGKQKLDIYDPHKVPSIFSVTRTVTEIDKDRLRASLETGTEIPGAVLMERGESLRIR